MKKEMKCPVCGSRICDGTEAAAKETIMFVDVPADKKDFDYQLKCRKCKSYINIIRTRHGA